MAAFTHPRASKGFTNRGRVSVTATQRAAGYTEFDVTVKHRGDVNSFAQGVFVTALDAGLYLAKVYVKDKTTLTLGYNNTTASPITPAASNILKYIIF